jgi:hypothetical protein
MFTAYFSGITQFTKLAGDYMKLNSVVNGGIVLDLGHDPGWIKVTGFWHIRMLAARRFRNYAVNGVVGPMAGDGIGKTTAFFGPWNRGFGGDSVLVLQSQTLNTFDPENSPVQLFLGGFDTESRVNDPFQDTSVLVFRYPATDFESLKMVMESIDFIPR